MSILPVLDGGDLGPDMIFEIFLGSSIDSLRKLSLVSRNWGTFLGSTSFNRLYYERNPITQHLALPVSENNLVLLQESNPLILSAQKLPLECEDMAMIGSCDGLLGFIHPNRGFLWNPASQLGKTFDLPPLISQQSFSTGLGFDSKRDDYKIVLLVSSAETQVKSYSFRNNSWIDLLVVPFSPEPNSNSKFVINGVPYWVGEDCNRKNVVFSFNPTSEAYTLISYPAVDNSQTVYVVRFAESIGGLAYSPSDHTLDIFLHQIGEGWVKFTALVGPIHNDFEVTLIQYFRGTIISGDSLFNTRFYKTEQLLTISDFMNPLQPRVNESYYHLKSMIRVPGAGCYYPSSVGEVFRDYMRRRLSLLRALTTESESLCKMYEFYEDVFPDSAGIRLYGLPNDWQVRETSAELHAKQGPGELPEPLRGIKFPKSDVEVTKWLCSVARSSDSWLVAVAFHMGASFGFDRAERNRLFLLINDLPTVYDVVRGAAINN